MSAEWVSVLVQIGLAVGVMGAFYVNTIAQKKAGEARQHATAEAARVKEGAAVALDSAVSKLYGIINDFGNRIARIETTIQSLPAGKDVHAIALQCSELIGELKELRAEMASVRDSSHANQRSLQRLEDFVINAKMEAHV